MAGFNVRKNRPILTAYMDLVKSRLNPHYDEVHYYVYRTTKKYYEGLKKEKESASKL
jgi:hypothetical protein